jgi:hypothetical protein
MVEDKASAGESNAKPQRTEATDREQMAEKALSEIRRIGSAASITKCHGLLNRIETNLLKDQQSQLLDPCAVEEVLVYLQRAAAVLKKL